MADQNPADYQIGTNAFPAFDRNVSFLDVAVTDRSKENEPDRKGNPRYTYYGIEKRVDRLISSADQRLANAIIGLGFIVVGEYAPGLEITEYNQVIRKDGEFYSLSPSVVIPYTTTGDWASEEVLFVSRGDFALRQDLIGVPGPGIISFSHDNQYQSGTLGAHSKKLVYVTDAPFNANIEGVYQPENPIQMAIDFVSDSGGGVVIITKGNYKLNQQLIGKPGVSIQCDSNAVLDFTDAPTFGSEQLESFIQFKGYAPAGPLRTNSDATITTSLFIGEDIINVSSASAFAVGDLIEISSDSEGPWKDTIKVTVGQLSKVVAVLSPTKIKINMPAFDDYLVSDAASIKKIIPLKNFSLYGLNVIGPGNAGSAEDGYNVTKGIGLYYCEDFSVERCSINGCMGWSIRPTSCYNFKIARNSIQTPREDGTLTGSMYGIPVASSCMFGVIEENEINGPTSGVLSSHLSRLLPVHYPGVSRLINVRLNHIYTTASGVAFHQDAEYWAILENFIAGQDNACIRIRTRNVLAADNWLFPSKTSADCNAILISHQPKNVTVRGNKGYVVRNHLVLVSQIEADFLPENIIVEGNEAIGRSNQTGPIITFSLPDGVGVSLGNSIKNNFARDCHGPGGNASFISVAGPWSVDIEDNSSVNCVGLNGVRLTRNVTNSIVSGNKIKGNGRVAYSIDSSIGPNVHALNNVAQGYSTLIIGGQHLASNTGMIDMGT